MSNSNKRKTKLVKNVLPQGNELRSSSVIQPVNEKTSKLVENLLPQDTEPNSDNITEVASEKKCVLKSGPLIKWCKNPTYICYKPPMEGYLMCEKHILNDKSGDFVQCNFVYQDDIRCIDAVKKNHNNETDSVTFCDYHKERQTENKENCIVVVKNFTHFIPKMRRPFINRLHDRNDAEYFKNVTKNPIVDEDIELENLLSSLRIVNLARAFPNRKDMHDYLAEDISPFEGPYENTNNTQIHLLESSQVSRTTYPYTEFEYFLIRKYYEAGKNNTHPADSNYGLSCQFIKETHEFCGKRVLPYSEYCHNHINTYMENTIQRTCEHIFNGVKCSRMILPLPQSKFCSSHIVQNDYYSDTDEEAD